MSHPTHEIPAKHVKIKESRWHVYITITKPDGSVVEFAASADGSLAESGIYFESREEFEADFGPYWPAD